MWLLLIDLDNVDVGFIKVISIINGLLELILVFGFLIAAFGYRELIPKKTTTRYYLAAFALGACYIYVQTPLNEIYNLAFGTQYDIVYQLETEKFFTWNAMGAMFLAPLAEEYFFRGYILEGLLQKYLPWTAILVSSLLFAAIHLPFDALYFEFMDFTVHHAYITFFGGLIAGLLYFKSGSVGPSILFHFGWNLMVYLI